MNTLHKRSQSPLGASLPIGAKPRPNAHKNNAAKPPCGANVSVGSTVVNLLVPALSKAENAAQRLRLYTGGKHARNVRYALRSSVR